MTDDAPWSRPLSWAAGQLALSVVVQWMLARLAARGWVALAAAETVGTVRRHRVLLMLLAVYPRLCVWLWVCGLYAAATWHLSPCSGAKSGWTSVRGGGASSPS